MITSKPFWWPPRLIFAICKPIYVTRRSFLTFCRSLWGLPYPRPNWQPATGFLKLLKTCYRQYPQCISGSTQNVFLRQPHLFPIRNKSPKAQQSISRSTCYDSQTVTAMTLQWLQRFPMITRMSFLMRHLWAPTYFLMYLQRIFGSCSQKRGGYSERAGTAMNLHKAGLNRYLRRISDASVKGFQGNVEGTTRSRNPQLTTSTVPDRHKLTPYSMTSPYQREGGGIPAERPEWVR